MMKLCSNVLKILAGKTLVTAESCTGGGIGAVLTAVPGSSEVYKGGIISYSNAVKHDMLGVSLDVLSTYGAVSEPVAIAMADGARRLLSADIAVSVTGLAGPGGDEFGHPVGTVYIGYSSAERTFVKECYFKGDRESVRKQAVETALKLILELEAQKTL